MDIYPAGEKPIQNISSKVMIEKIANNKTFYLPDLKNAKKFILSEIEDNSILILMGAGSISSFAKQFIGKK